MKSAMWGRYAAGTVRQRVGAVVATVMAMALAGSVQAGAGYLGPGDEQLQGGEYFDRIAFSGNAGDELLIGLPAATSTRT